MLPVNTVDIGAVNITPLSPTATNLSMIELYIMLFKLVNTFEDC